MEHDNKKKELKMVIFSIISVVIAMVKVITMAIHDQHNIYQAIAVRTMIV